MDIEKAATTDLDECERVLRAAFARYISQLGRRQTSDAYSWLAKSISANQVLTARDGVAILGVAVISDQNNTRTIDQIAVDPDSQGRGIGSALIQRIEQEAIAADIAILQLDTAEKMTDLIRLYTTCGFVIVSKGPPKHGLDNHKRVFMRKIIQTAA